MEDWRNRAFLLSDKKAVKALMTHVRETGRMRWEMDREDGAPDTAAPATGPQEAVGSGPGANEDEEEGENDGVRENQDGEGRADEEMAEEEDEGGMAMAEVPAVARGGDWGRTMRRR